MTTAHHIPNKRSYNDMEEVEGETILLGKEIQNKRIETYKTYLEALKKYDEKEEIKKALYLQECKNGGFANFDRETKYIRLKKARDKNFKNKWTINLSKTA